LGIDLTCKETRPSAYLGLDNELHLIDYGSRFRDSDILSLVLSYHFSLVAIDAPLSLPKGLCCLEESCPCQAEAEGRSCERELAKQGIGLFRTTKKSIIKDMVCRGIRLKAELEAKGCQVIEVYPYATKVRLWGRNIPKKTTPCGLTFLKQHISLILPSTVPYLGKFNHDLCDAAIAAYTAFLYYNGKTELCGKAEEGVICLPH
jgi:predicted nuclease with RNAse H fold